MCVCVCEAAGALLDATPVDDGKERVQQTPPCVGSHSEGFVCMSSGTVVQLYVVSLWVLISRCVLF